MGAPDNPFCLSRHRAGVLPWLPSEEVDRLWARLLERRVVQLVGPEGSGKTSLLRALGRRAEAQGWVYRESRDAAALVPAAGCVLGLDEADVVARRELSRLLRRAREAGGLLVLTSHRVLWRRNLPVHRCRVDAQQALALVDLVLAESPELPRLVERDEVVHALARCRGNLRVAFERLYDLYEARYQKAIAQGIQPSVSSGPSEPRMPTRV